MAEPTTPEDLTAALEKARAETRAAFENRALTYLHLFEVLRDELGTARATELMKRAIYRRGVEIGEKYRAAAEAGDLDAIGRIFCEGSPSGGGLFEPAIEARGDVSIVLRMTACPLKEAWQAAGASAEDVDLLCEIAAAVDEGTFEGAGLNLVFRDRLGKPGSTRCLLELKPRA